jgi:hypothetical protein
MLLTGGPLEVQARYLRDTLRLDQAPDETTLLAAENMSLLSFYRRAIIGKRDHTLDPTIPAGSIVQIDTQKRAISSRRDWTHESQRPIYFFTTRDSYVCGWLRIGQEIGLADPDSPSLVAHFQPPLEISKRHRSDGACCLRGYSVDGMNITPMGFRV